ncbi:S8 family peptidase [Georgenia sp. H159]|uniref:S8 family peptidase n=1 Tax=Georgenia sp. H159 TaxID=3076115 RepID=UPI002D76855A|nr:S8 family serine peptidase [Georgenia sp. H159]
MKLRSTALSLSLVAVVALASPATARNVFDDATTTADGYHTYDSDQIDIEHLTQTGEGVYVAVLDTGLLPYWSEYFPEERVATHLGAGFYQTLTFKPGAADACEAVESARGPLRQTNWVSARGSSHGTHVASTILGYSYDSSADDAEGYPLPPIQVRGIAPDVTVIPVKVLADYTIPRLKGCDDPSQQVVFGTDEMVAAGIDYVTDLKESGALGDAPVVINMSLGGSELVGVEQDALDRAIVAGVIIVASAGNEGTEGMGFPGAYAPVISVGAAGWTGEWTEEPGEEPDNGFRYRLWWLKNEKGTPPAPGDLPLPAGSGEVAEGLGVVAETYVADFSSRELEGQQLDVLAPGSWVRGPFPGTPGYNHLPWWSSGQGGPGNYFYVGGTSMAAPHVSAVAALMLEDNPALTQAQVESALKDTAVDIPAGSRQVWDPFQAVPGWSTISWAEDATGEGLVQADEAVAAVTP